MKAPPKARPKAQRPRAACLLAALGAAAACGLSIAAPPAISFELARLDGKAFVSLDDYAGRPVLLNFWGSECPPCLNEMPLLFTQAPRHAGLQFLGIAVDQRPAASRFLARLQPLQPSYPQLVASIQPEVLLRRFGNKAGALPFTVVVDARHEVCAARVGEVDATWIAAAAAACGAAPAR